MSTRLLGCAGIDAAVTRGAPAKRKPTRNPQRLGDCDTGRIVTLRLIVTGHGDDSTFVRALDADGRESSPRHLPDEWPICEGEL